MMLESALSQLDRQGESSCTPPPPPRLHAHIHTHTLSLSLLMSSLRQFSAEAENNGKADLEGEAFELKLAKVVVE